MFVELLIECVLVAFFENVNEFIFQGKIFERHLLTQNVQTDLEHFQTLNGRESLLWKNIFSNFFS